MTAREEICQAITDAQFAAGTLGSVNQYVGSSTTPGTCFPYIDRIEYPDRFGGICHWSVAVVLPQKPADAEQWFEAMAPQVRAALLESRALVITSMNRAQLDIPSVGVLPVALINGFREAEELENV